MLAAINNAKSVSELRFYEEALKASGDRIVKAYYQRLVELSDFKSFQCKEKGFIRFAHYYHNTGSSAINSFVNLIHCIQHSNRLWLVSTDGYVMNFLPVENFPVGSYILSDSLYQYSENATNSILCPNFNTLKNRGKLSNFKKFDKDGIVWYDLETVAVKEKNVFNPDWTVFSHNYKTPSSIVLVENSPDNSKMSMVSTTERNRI